MALYAYQTAITWSLLYLVYFLFLKNKTFFIANRFYLLISLIIGLVLPFLKWFPSSTNTTHLDYVIHLPEFIINASVTQLKIDQQIQWFTIIYWLGVILLSSKLCYGLYKLSRLKSLGNLERHADYNIVTTEANHLPFSFLSCIFISNKYQIGQGTENVMKHEIIHIKQRHTWDILLIELIQCFFWFNPILWFYKSAIKLIHEYIADSLVATSSSFTDYLNLLLSGAKLRNHQHNLVNTFFHSQIQKRITMLESPKSGLRQILYYSLSIPMIWLCSLVIPTKNNPLQSTLIFKQREVPTISVDTFPAPPPPPAIPNLNQTSPPPPSPPANAKIRQIAPPPPPIPPSDVAAEEVFEVVDEMPRFPGCEDLKSLKEKDDCSLQKLFAYIGTNLKYPEAAKKKGIEGMVVVKFTVDKRGYINDLIVLRDPGEGLGNEAKRMFETMNQEKNRWTPGKKNGKVVNVSLTLPIKYKLDSEENK